MSISYSAIHQVRILFRSKIASHIRKDLQLASSLVVHWDGKLIPDFTGKNFFDRLPVLVSGVRTQQLLSVSKLKNSTGEEQEAALTGVLLDWNIHDKVKAICFDTTASNTSKSKFNCSSILLVFLIDLKTIWYLILVLYHFSICIGRLNGAFAILEQILGKNLVHLACQHHIFDLLLRTAFVTSFSTTSGPGPCSNLCRDLQGPCLVWPIYSWALNWKTGETLTNFVTMF